MVGIGGVAAGVAGPHVPFGAALGDPFGEHLARAARLGDAEGEDAGLEGVADTRHGADEGQAVGRVGDRSVDDLGDACLFQQGHAGAGIGDVPLQPVEVVGEELEGEILGHRVGGVGPMGAAVALIGAEVEAVFLLPEVVAGVHVAEEREFAVCGRPFLEFGDLFGGEVLVAHHHHGNGAAAVGFEPFADLLCVVACGVDDDFAGDVALVGVDDPVVAAPRDAGGGGEAEDLGAHHPRALGQRLCQLRGVDVAVVGVVERTRDVVELDEGVSRADLVMADEGEVHALVAAHAHGAGEFLHPLLRMGEADRAGDVVVHGVVHLLGEAAVEG